MKTKKLKKKSKRSKRSRSSSSSSEEWVEKEVADKHSEETQKSEIHPANVFTREIQSTILSYSRDSQKREHEDWMNFSSFATSSKSQEDRNKKQKLEREDQTYDPRKCGRELNPYWRNGGDGLPKFKKPEEDLASKEVSLKDRDYKKSRNQTPKWKKTSDTFNTDSGNDNKIEGNIEEFSEKDLNVLGAKIVKAEILGNHQLVSDLKAKLEKAKSYVESTKNSILLTHTDTLGRSVPLKLQSGSADSNYKRKNVDTHSQGQRIKYFPDDEKYSLKQMFEAEKYKSPTDINLEFATTVSKVSKNDDLDDVFLDNIRKKKSDFKECDKAISEYEHLSKKLDNCNKCIQSDLMEKRLMVYMGDTTYLNLPRGEPLTEHHCQIIPVRHVTCSTQLDENEWGEIVNIQKTLIKMFEARQEVVVFFENAKYMKQFPHMSIHCVPIPKEKGEMAPIYFKKAIDESETEWSLNKKLISLKGRDVRKAVPKGLPYFSVNFGIGDGFAHVIEDEKYFPSNFAQEIIGGMLDLPHSSWRKPKKQSFEAQNKRVQEFSSIWKSFESTL